MSPAMKGHTRRAAMLAGLLGILAAFTTQLSRDAGATAATQPASKTVRSADLASDAPTAIGGFSAVLGGPQQARQEAARLQTQIALPDGGNFNGIRWEEAGGTFTQADVAFVTQYNAACQWYRALSDGRETSVAARIVLDLPSWSALRDTEPAAGLQQAAQELAGGSPGPTARALLGECQAAHQREVQWAQGRGLQPSV